MSNIINYSEFENVDIRLGTIVKAYEYKELKKPSIILEIDFGEIIGIKKTSAQILKHYSPDKILGKQIAAVINFKPKQIGKIMSEAASFGKRSRSDLQSQESAGNGTSARQGKGKWHAGCTTAALRWWSATCLGSG